jgi:hypothetical protein
MNAFWTLHVLVFDMGLSPELVATVAICAFLATVICLKIWEDEKC